MTDSHPDIPPTAPTRREMLRMSAAAAAGALIPAAFPAIAAGPATTSAIPGDTLNLAILGAGAHGRSLINCAVKMPGIRFKAVCDIWPYNLQYAARLLKKYDHLVNTYADYQDLLEKEKDLDAVIVATPDWVHAEQALTCLKAGRHVYLEKEMATTVEDARKVVQAARQSGKCVQVGRQHRSNVRYHAALDYIDGKKALGRITHVCGQWHGHKRYDFDWPKGQELDAAALKKYGYDTMERLRNWRWYTRFSAGEVVNLGSHQIDVLNWFLHARPVSVYAGGGLDYYQKHEWYDNLSAIYEWQYQWQGKTHTVRGDYRILNTTEVGGIFETFVGDEGTLTISELADVGGITREPGSPEAEWEKSLQSVKDRTYPPIPAPPGPARSTHAMHLENFLDAVRGRAKLTCPPEVAFPTTVSALKANDSMKEGKRLTFAEEDFRI
jgi:predicted dehydrogenase